MMSGRIEEKVIWEPLNKARTIPTMAEGGFAPFSLVEEFIF